MSPKKSNLKKRVSNNLKRRVYSQKRKRNFNAKVAEEAHPPVRNTLSINAKRVIKGVK